MFGIGMQEVAIILVVALIFIGPAKLPQVARSIGKGMRELRRASDDLKSAVMIEMDDEEESWRKPAKPSPSKLGAYSDQSVSSAAVAGSLVATGEGEAKAEGDSADASDGEGEAVEPAHTVSRDGAFAVAGASAATDEDGPDPMDANDHTGMPFAPDSPQMQEAIDSARAKIAAKDADANEAADSSESKSAAS